MINQSTLDSMKAMRLTAMAAELERQLEDAATYRTLGFEDVSAFWWMQNGTGVRRISSPAISRMHILLLLTQP